jgi:hypothetical protein
VSGKHARSGRDAELSADVLPENVRTLLRDHLPSFECLEVLLLLHALDGEPASVESIGRRTGIAVELVLQGLIALERSGILRKNISGPAEFRYAPATAWLQNACDDLARLHREQRAAIMSEMSINAIGRIRSNTLRAFTDAFVLDKKKREPDA